MSFDPSEVANVRLVELVPNLNRLVQKMNELVKEAQHFIVPGVEVLYNITRSGSLKTTASQLVTVHDLCTSVSVGMAHAPFAASFLEDLGDQIKFP